MNNIAFTQNLSDKINEQFNPDIYATPGKNEITLIENLANGDVAEFIVKTKDCKVSDFLYSVHATKDELAKKALTFVTEF